MQNSVCNICSIDSYCPAGSTTPTSCPVDTFSLAGSSSVTDCQPASVSVNLTINSVNTNLNQSQFQNALPSNVAVVEYQDIIVATQVNCYQGYYCPPDTTTPIACPAGTYNNLSNIVSLSGCLTCPQGSYCPLASAVPTSCAAGSYMIDTGAIQQSDCVVCPTGNYCPIGSITPQNCSAGTYNPLINQSSAASCLACPAGQYCPIATTTPTACSAGTYRGTTGGTQQDYCTTCPTGNYCPIQSVDPTNCSAGTYNPSTGSVDSSDCYVCEAGLYCPLASTWPTPCSAGTYRDTTGGTQQADCTACPTGNYCPINSINPTNCSAGTYNPSTGSAGFSSCLTCPAGNSCPIATTTPISCSANTFSSAGVSTCTFCPSFSTSGVTSPNNCTCTAGRTQTFTTTTGSSLDVSYMVVGVSSYGGIGFVQDVFTPPIVAALTINGYSNVTVLKGSKVTLTSLPFGGSPIDMTIYSGVSFSSDITQTAPRSSLDATYSGQQVIDFVIIKTIGTRVVYSTGVTGAGTAALVWDTTNVPPGIYYLGSTRTYKPSSPNNLQTFLQIFIASPVPVTLTYPNIYASSFLPVMASSGDIVKIHAQWVGNVVLYCSDLSDLTGGSATMIGSGNPLTFNTSSVDTATTFCYITNGVGSTSRGQLYIFPRPVASAPPIISTLSCPNCSSGYYSNTGDSACTTCGYGYYSSAVSSSCTVCPVGTMCNSVTTPAPVSCGLGNYQGATGQSFCSTCPQNQYCSSPTTSVPLNCPANTVSAAGSSSLLQCRCVQGYVCSYTKRITAVVTLNTTLSRFNADTGGVRSAFINAVASAAGVSASQVTINLVKSTGNRRRLLADGDMETEQSFIDVHAAIDGAERLHRLDFHLAQHSATLHHAHSWQESHSLSTTSVKRRPMLG